MLPITQELIASLHHYERTGQSPALCTCFIHTILKCGSIKDAEALLPVFLERPSDYNRRDILFILGRYGSTAMAQQLFDRCFNNNRLNAEMPEDLLHILGQLQFAPVINILLIYALDTSSDYYTSKSAVLGLLHFSCEGYKVQIEEAIRNTFDKSLFNEFVPSLVCKLRNREELLPLLYEHGSTVCSTDCNSGILLGFALCGTAGAVYFRKALLNPIWETGDTGTGTANWASKGMEYAGIHFKELYTIVQEESSEVQLTYKLSIIESLLNARLGRIKEPLLIEGIQQKESLASIYKSLFSWETPNNRNNILDLARKVGKEDEYYRLENLLLVKVEEELLLNTLYIANK